MMQVEGKKLVIDEIVICCSNSFRAMSIEGEETEHGVGKIFPLHVLQSLAFIEITSRPSLPSPR